MDEPRKTARDLPTVYTNQRDIFGTRRQEITPVGNRREPLSAFKQAWDSYLYLPSRPMIAIVHCGNWVMSVATITLVTSVLPVVLQAGVFLAVGVLLILPWLAVYHDYSLLPYVLIRMTLIIIGMCIGGVV